MNNLGNLPGTTWDVVSRLWPLLLIAAGLDGFWRGQGYAGATVVTGLGVIFLMGNLGYLSFTAWDLILRLWPIFLVALGLDIILGRQRPWSAALGVLIGLFITAGIFWLITSAPFTSDYKTEEVTFNLNNATAARGTIAMPVGKLELSSGAESDTLLTGALHMNSNEEFSKSLTFNGNTTTFRLDSHGFAAFVPFSRSGGQEDWVIHVNPAPTYNLTLQMAAGDMVINLGGLKFSDLSIQTAVGKATIKLPSEGPLRGTIKTAVGETVIYVPSGVPVRLTFDKGLVSFVYPPNFNLNHDVLTSPNFSSGGAAIDLKIDHALGSIRVEYLSKE
jgi:hypothetical protein